MAPTRDLLRAAYRIGEKASKQGSRHVLKGGRDGSTCTAARSTLKSSNRQALLVYSNDSHLIDRNSGLIYPKGIVGSFIGILQ